MRLSLGLGLSLSVLLPLTLSLSPDLLSLLHSCTPPSQSSLTDAYPITCL